MRWLIAFLLLSSVASAATVTKSIGSGKDYTTVTLWEAASYGATASDDAVGEMYGTTVETVIIDDETPISITLQSAAGEEHDGTPDSGAGIQHDGTAGTKLISVAQLDDSGDIPIVIQDLEFDMADGNIASHVIFLQADDCTFRRNIIHSWTRSRVNNHAVILVNVTTVGTLATVENNLVCSITNAGTGDTHGIWLFSDDPTKCFNNTVTDIGNTSAGADLTYGITASNYANIEIRNNLVTDVTSDAGTGAAYADDSPINVVHSNNISDDASSPDSAFRSKTITYVAAGSEDYHLDGAETDAIDQGSTDADVPSDDIDGDTRDASPDIGMDEVVTGGILIFQQQFTGIFPCDLHYSLSP